MFVTISDERIRTLLSWLGLCPFLKVCSLVIHVHIIHYFTFMFAGARKDTNNETFCDFRWRLFHGCLAAILKSVEPFMCDWDVVRCSDHHFRRAIYGIGPYIADYPEQTAASGVVYGWCPG